MKIKMLKGVSGAMNGHQNDIRFFKAGQVYDQEKGEIASNLVEVFLRDGFAKEIKDEPEASSKAKVPGPGGRKGLSVPENKGLYAKE
jgi:hypothetical protein